MDKMKKIFSRWGRTLESRRKELIGEAAVYGMMAVIYSALFFFGALYPRYGIPPRSIRYEEESGEEEIVYKSLILEQIKEWF